MPIWRRGALPVLALLAFVCVGPLVPAHAHADPQDRLKTENESVHGTLKDPDGEPLPDVEVTVTSDGEEIGSDTTDDDGAWSVDVPESGEYTVEVDLDTVPDSIHPRKKGGETLENVQIRKSADKTVLIPFVPKDTEQESADGDKPDDKSDKGKTGKTPFIAKFIQKSVLGLKLGIIIAITAIGLSLVFGTTRLINFAHGELVVIGAVAAYFFSTSPLGLPLVIATVLAIGVGILVAVALERGIWRPMRIKRAGKIQMFVVSIGLSILLRHLILAVYGSRRHFYGQYTVQKDWTWGPIALAPRDIVIMILSAVVLLGVAVMLLRTRIGKATRAVADNSDLAAASGIDVDRVILVVWIMGGALAAFGGVMYGLTEAVFWDMGLNLLLLMFAGVILGGLGSAFGAVVGSLIIGLVAQLSTLWFPSELQNAWGLLALIVVLLIRPQGVLGRAERAG